ncbi:hypothetical protein RHMOL_Rhmol10G0181000 [Rhododendron molle]|uniref:Uncharacterized protein n=1 Tax=Rhododendron molle TaxID=49168 RepID=A0ACC0M4S4_RHOML|nr:hypothetical protein RHMOL_Rhmol10G0181000 [Rhododendron molle]
MVHTSFLLTYFYEHFHTIALVLRYFPALTQWSRAERCYEASSDASWYEACDVATNFTASPYSSAPLGVVGMGQCLLSVGTSISAASRGDSVARAVVNATLIAIPRWLL